MVSANPDPLKLLNVTLTTVFGTTNGRVALERTLIEGVSLPPIFLTTLQASHEMFQVGQFLQLFPYFWAEKNIAKYKIAKKGEIVSFFKDERRQGRTSFSFDLAFRPLKGVSQCVKALAGAHTVAKIYCRFFYPDVDIGSGGRIHSLAHVAKVLSYIEYLMHLKTDQSRSLNKGVIGFFSESLLACCHLSKNHHLQLVAGIVACLTQGYLESRKEEKRERENKWLEECKIASPDNLTETETSLPVKFIQRLFGTTYFISSLSETEQFGRTLICINGFATSFSTLLGVKKHPIFSYFALAGGGMYGLILHKYFLFFFDPSVKKTATAYAYFLMSGCDSLMFCIDNQLLPFKEEMGRILILKTFFTIMASSLVLRDLYKDSKERENTILESINAVTKVPMTLNSTTAYHGYPLGNKIVITFGTLLGFNQIARGLYWESLREDKNRQVEKKLANGWKNQVQVPPSTSDTKFLAKQT